MWTIQLKMEVYQTDNHYIILDGEYSLWCSRKHGTLEAKTGRIKNGAVPCHGYAKKYS